MIKGLFPHDIDEVIVGEMNFLDYDVFHGNHDEIGKRHLEECAKNGYIELFSWLLRLVSRRDAKNDIVFIMTDQQVANFYQDELMTVPCIATNNHQWQFFMYLLDNDVVTYKWCRHCIRQACRYGFQPFLERVCERNTLILDEWTTGTLELLAEHGHFELFVWAVTQAGCKVDRFLEKCINYPDTRILEWCYHGGYIDVWAMNLLGTRRNCNPKVKVLFKKWANENKHLLK